MTAFFRFQELPLGDLLCDGEAEAAMDGEIIYAAITRAIDPEIGEPIKTEFAYAEIAEALEQHRRNAIDSAIADARWDIR